MLLSASNGPAGEDKEGWAMVTCIRDSVHLLVPVGIRLPQSQSEEHGVSAHQESSSHSAKLCAGPTIRRKCFIFPYRAEIRGYPRTNDQTKDS